MIYYTASTCIGLAEKMDRVGETTVGREREIRSRRIKYLKLVVNLLLSAAPIRSRILSEYLDRICPCSRNGVGAWELIPVQLSSIYSPRGIIERRIQGCVRK